MKKIIFFATILISINYSTCSKSKILNGQASDHSQEQHPQNLNGLQKQASLSHQVSQSIENTYQDMNNIAQMRQSQELSHQSYEEDLSNQALKKNLQKQESFVPIQSSQEDDQLLSKGNNQMLNQLGNAVQQKYLNQSDHSNEQELVSQNSPSKNKMLNNLESVMQKQFKQSNEDPTYSQIMKNHPTVNQSSQEDLFNPQDQKLQNVHAMNNLQHTKTDKLSQEDMQELDNLLQQKKLNEAKLRNQMNGSQTKQQMPLNKSQNSRLSWGSSKFNPLSNQSIKIQQVKEIQEPKIKTKPVLKNENSVANSVENSMEDQEQSQELQLKGSQVKQNKQNKVELDKDQQKELLRLQNYQNQQYEKSKLLKRSQSQIINANKDYSCSKDLLEAFGLQIDEARKAGDIEPQASGVKEKTLCRRNMGTCCTYDEMMSVADSFAETANKFREQFIVLEELYVMFKGTKIFDLLNDLKQIDKCSALMDSHVLIPKDQDGKPLGTFETTVAIEIQSSVAGLFNEMRRYKKHIISTYGNVVCSICSPAESKYFKLNEEKELQELDITFANCQEIMDLKDFEIRVAEVYSKYLLPLVSVIECDKQDDDPQVDEIELDLFIEEKKTFDSCFNDYSLENPDCQEICTDFDIKTYTFPGNFFKVSKQMLSFFFKKFAGGDVNEYYQDYKDKDFNEYANYESFVFYPALKVPKVEEDIYKAEIKLVESRGINITNDYINRIFLEHNQHNQKTSTATLNVVFSMIMLMFF